MSRPFRALVLAAALLLGGSAGYGGDPVFTWQTWGGGDPVRFKFTASPKSVSTYALPSNASRVVGTRSLKKGDIVSFVEKLAVTREPGIVKANEPVDVAGRSFGAVARLTSTDYYVQSQGSRVSKKLAAGDTIQVLNLDLREGTLTCLFRLNGDVILHEREETSDAYDEAGGLKCLPGDSTKQSEPAVEFWARLAGSPPQWIRDEGSFLQEDYW